MYCAAWHGVCSALIVRVFNASVLLYYVRIFVKGILYAIFGGVLTVVMGWMCVLYWCRVYDVYLINIQTCYTNY